MAKRAAVVLAVFGLAVVTSCAPPVTPGPVLVEYGHSFGFCVGYCTAVLHVNGDAVTVDATDRRSGRTVTNDGTLTSSGRDRVAASTVSIDVDSIAPVYGCPDCADGGAAFLTLRATNDVGTTYELGRPPPELQPADAIGDELLDGLRSCQPTAAFTLTGSCTPV